MLANTSKPTTQTHPHPPPPHEKNNKKVITKSKQNIKTFHSWKSNQNDIVSFIFIHSSISFRVKLCLSVWLSVFLSLFQSFYFFLSITIFLS